MSKKLRIRPKIRRLGFAKNQEGTAAIEFAIVTPVFLAMMFSIFEVGWFFFTNSTLDAITAQAGRLVRTGQVQGWGPSDGVTNETQRFQKLYDHICDVTKAWGDCSTRLTLELKTYASFADLAADATAPTCADAPAADIASIPFEPGAELQIIRVRVCLIYNTINPAIGVNLSEGTTNQKHLISTLIFRNEPYEKNV